MAAGDFMVSAVENAMFHLGKMAFIESSYQRLTSTGVISGGAWNGFNYNTTITSYTPDDATVATWVGTAGTTQKQYLLLPGGMIDRMYPREPIERDGYRLAVEAHGLSHRPGGTDALFAFARKAADESVVSSATLQDDDHLLVAVLANQTWKLDIVAFYDAVVAADIEFNLTFPAGAGGQWGIHGLGVAATADTGELVAKSAALGTSLVSGGAGAGVPVMATMWALVRVAGTGGNLRLQWAQRVSDATATILKADSYIHAVRVV